MEKISVIIPVYNTSDYLPLLFQSIEKQTYSNIEIIFVDDASTDNSYKLCKEFCGKDKSNRKVIHKSLNEGSNPARYTGLMESSGSYITFVDSDDWFESDYIQCLADKIPFGADIVCLPIIKEDCKGTIVEIIGSVKNERCIWDKETALLKLFEGRDVRSYMHNKLFKREILKDVDFSYKKPFEDLISTTMAFSNANTIVVGNTPKYHYIVRDNSLSSRTKYAYLAAIEAMIIRKDFYTKHFHNKDIIKLADYEIYDWFIETAGLFYVKRNSSYYNYIKKMYKKTKKTITCNSRIRKNIPFYLFSPLLFVFVKRVKSILSIS